MAGLGTPRRDSPIWVMPVARVSADMLAQAIKELGL